MRLHRWMLLTGSALVLLAPVVAQVDRDPAPFIALAAALRAPVPARTGMWAASERLRFALQDFEARIRQSRAVAPAYRAAAQSLLLDLREGNGQVAVGRDGGLVLVDDLRYVWGPAFLDPRQLESQRRRLSAPGQEGQPDPRPALLALNAELARRGVQMIVVPIPPKVVTAPDKVGLRGDPREVAQNASYQGFLESLAREDVPIYDPSADLRSVRRDGGETHLRADNHWTPLAVEAAARGLAAAIRDHGPPGVRWRDPPVGPAQREARRGVGLLSRLLGLDDLAQVSRPQTVWVRNIAASAGAAPAEVASRRVLIVGDSYSAIYASPGLGWGAHAGLADQLSYDLGEPVSLIAVNDGGALESRLQLALRGGRDPGFLAQVRVVIVEFSMSELATGDWRPLPLALKSRRPPS